MRVSIPYRGKRRVLRTARFFGTAPLISMDCVPGGRTLVPVQRITGFQRKLASDFHYLHAAVDGIDVHQTDGPRGRSHAPNKLIVRRDDHDRWVVRTLMIG